ncbi:hypothetical protein K9M74_04195 [Candidatus Woesearchaeota archaeon]|nr:hypothetical protein [Candidatus Woesearchaeota archaeon]
MQFITNLFLLLIVCLFFITACDIEDGVYDHLQNQEVGTLHKVDFVNETNDEGSADEKGVFEHLQENLANDYCMGRFTKEEQAFFELEQQAYIEFNPNVCDKLPVEPLVFTCDGQEIIYYSQERCYSFFMVDMIE